MNWWRELDRRVAGCGCACAILIAVLVVAGTGLKYLPIIAVVLVAYAVRLWNLRRRA